MSRQAPYIPLGCTQQDRIAPTMYSRRIDELTQGASCCSEFLEDEPRKPRLGPIGPFHRLVLAKQPTFTWAAVTALAIACAVVRWLP